MLAESSKLLESQIDLWRGPIRDTIMKAYELMPEDRVDWTPAENMIPMGMVFLHICETSDWWYDDIMRGKPATELALPDVPCLPKDQIKGHLDIHWDRLDRFFAEPPEILDRVFTKTYKKWKFENTGGWIFTHLLEHDIHHRCQIYQYLRILGIAPPR